MKKKTMSKTLAMLVAMVCVTNNMVALAQPNVTISDDKTKSKEMQIENSDARVNLVKDPSFEEDPDINDSEIPAWTIIGSAGNWNNYPHTGRVQCWLDPGSSNIIKQTIEAPYNGYYTGAAYVATGGGNAKLALFNSADGKVIKEVTLPSNSNYVRYELEPIYLNKGEKIDIGLIGGSGWCNGDDFEFYYDRSNQQNLLLNGEFDNNNGWNLENAEINNGIVVLKDDSSKITQTIKVPSKGYYYLNLNIKPLSDNVKVTVGGKTQTLTTSDSYKAIELKDINLEKNSDIDVVIEGKAEIENANFMYDIEKMNFIKPEANNVTVNGDAEIDGKIKVTYDFNDLDNHVEGKTKIKWMISDTKDEGYSEIVGENEHTLVIPKDAVNKYIKAVVIPGDEYGIEGDSGVSNVIGPIDVNIINNPSFENNGLGWRYYGSNIRYDNSYAGRIRARIANGAFNYITQEITVTETGVYDLSAYVNVEVDGAKIGIMTLSDNFSDSEIIAYSNIEKSTGYKRNELKNIPLEKGEKVKIFFSGTEKAVSVDNVKLIRNTTVESEKYNNIISLNIEGQKGNSIINKKDKVINFKVPYGTDISNLVIEDMQLSEEATSNVTVGQELDLTNPFNIKVNNNGKEDIWTVKCEVQEKETVVKSSNKFLEDNFNWSIDKTKQFVMTGKTGLVNRDERNNDGTGIANYMPSYWAGYYDRTAFYGRDFVHQATGGQIAGLTDENFSMFKTFAKNSTESRKWYTLWAINFDGTPHTIDYKDDTNFVREVPAQFELVEKAYEQYLWTGDERYINDPELWNFYTKVMTDYISLHDDQNPNGIAEGYGGIFQGSCTYNERGKFPIEAADAIGSQYQAMLAYAGMLEAKGQVEESKVWFDKAEELKKYFNEEWSVIDPSNPNDRYATILQKDGKKLNAFGKENSWFIPMKLLSEPGERNNQYLDFISESLGDGIGTTADAPKNIEAYTYIPEAYFPYNRNEEAWKWMKYIMSVKDEAHERPTQGTNGDYPEISFTFVSHTVEGLMGIEVDAAKKSIVTAPHLSSEIDWVSLDNLKMGENELGVTHNGLTMTTLDNKSSEDLLWEARFYGDYKNIIVDGEYVPAKQKLVNGELVSYANVSVKDNTLINTEATNEVNKENLVNKINEAKALKEKDYTKDSWKSFIAVLDNSQKVAEDAAATQESVDKAILELDNAIKSLVKIKDTAPEDINKESLLNKIKEAKKLKEKEYTKDSWKAFVVVLENSEKVTKDKEATQEKVDKAVIELDNAIKSLVKVKDTVKEEDSIKDNPTEENSKEDNETIKNNKLPNTGAVVGTGLITLLGVGLTLTGARISKKRKED